MGILSAIASWFKNESWNWFLMLDYQEWFVVLGIVTVFGTLCMRGFGSRDHV